MPLVFALSKISSLHISFGRIFSQDLEILVGLNYLYFFWHNWKSFHSLQTSNTLVTKSDVLFFLLWCNVSFFSGHSLHISCSLSFQQCYNNVSRYTFLWLFILSSVTGAYRICGFVIYHFGEILAIISSHIVSVTSFSPFSSTCMYAGNTSASHTSLKIFLYFLPMFIFIYFNLDFLLTCIPVS